MGREITCSPEPLGRRRARRHGPPAVRVGAILLLASSLHLVDTSALSGQRPKPPEAGQRVRLQAPSLGPDALSGRLADVSADSAWIHLGEGEAPEAFRRIVPGSRLQRFEQSSGQHSHGLYGALAGASAGALAGTLVWSAIKEADDDAVLNGYAATGGMLAGGLVGLGIGSLVRSESWQLAPSAWVRSRTFVVGVSVSKRR